MAPSQHWWLKGVRLALLRVKIKTLTRDIRRAERELERLVRCKRMAEEQLLHLSEEIN